jgi:hypothetical protein
MMNQAIMNATAKMEAARKERDSAKSQTTRNKAFDNFLYWQSVVGALTLRRQG